MDGNIFAKVAAVLLLGLVSIPCRGQQVNLVNLGTHPIDLSLGSASVTSSENRLVLSTGKISRTWEWTGFGLRTISVLDRVSGREWCAGWERSTCDWNLPGMIDKTTKAKLVSLTASIGDDEHFTSQHIEVVAEIAYETNVAIRYVVWVFPDAPGLRTQLSAKALHGMNRATAKNVDARGEFIPMDWAGLDRRAIGYYSDTQRRNAANLELLKEEVTSGTVLRMEQYDWPSVLVAEDNQGGMVLVKESHKCVNQPGVRTGSFYADTLGMSSTGWGLQVQDLLAERWRAAWATWCIVYSGDARYQRELAIKTFDRLRYPVNKELDIYTMANTWGSGNESDAAREENVLREITSQADLGIDVQQIDEGWQNAKGLHWSSSTSWRPHPDRYPHGWQRVIDDAQSKNIRMGIWFAVGNLNDDFEARYGNNWYGQLSDFKRIYDQTGFRYYKFDMANLKTYDQLESLMGDARSFVKYANNNIRINWDVTEHEARTGFYFAKDLGNIFLANRPPKVGKQVVYVPYLVLRDAWQLAKYVNINKFQVSIQNVDLTDKSVSNGHLYGHAYSVAVALMASPLFFQETQYYSDAARQEVRNILSVYKRNRNELYEGYVFGIGDKPNDRNWTGFQNHNLQTNNGYLLLFRELHNETKRHRMQLNFLAGTKLRVTNLMTEQQHTLKADGDGFVEFEIARPADFLFLRYEVL